MAALRPAGKSSRSQCSSVSSVIRAAEAETGDLVRAQRDVHDLRLAVEVEGVVTALTADPAVLDTAERGAQVAHILRVDPAHAGVDRLRYAMRSLHVVRPDVGGQAIARGVRPPDRIGLVAERHGDKNRPED